MLRQTSFAVLSLLLIQTTSYAITLQSTSFKANANIPKQYTCDGQDISPALSWSNAPAKTVAFALTITDPDAPGGLFYHWILYNIPNNTYALKENHTTFTDGTIVGKNSVGSKNYFGPCPPKGESHHYIFTIYALDSHLNMENGVDPRVILDAIEAHHLQSASLTATYRRQ